MSIAVSCGMFVGPPRQRGGTDWYYEPDECSWVTEIDEMPDEAIICLECGAVLEDSSHYEEIPDS